MNDADRLFEATGNNPRAWFDSVELLTDAAKKLRERKPAALPDGTELMLASNAVCAMLLGYAIECALKGLLVKTGHRLVDKGKFIRSKGTGDHELGQLAEVMNDRSIIAVSSAERRLLTRLSAFVKFAGRYPVPTKASDLAAVEVPGKGKTSPSFLSHEDLDLAELLLNRFATALNPFLEFKSGGPPSDR